MLKSGLLSLVLCLIVMAGSAFGTIYNYTTSGMDGSDWVGVSNGAWLGWATVTSSPDRQRFFYNGWYGEGVGRGSMMGTAWTARPGEKITKIEFNYVYNSNPAFIAPVIYVMGATETALSSSTPVVWAPIASGWFEGSDSIVFSESDNVQKVALGLNVPQYGYYNYLVEFSDVIITTVPEPATLGLLGLGCLLLRRKK
jgi:hypothetical protein